MNSKKHIVLLLILILASILNVSAQNIEFAGSPIEIDINGYKTGQIQWQYSENKSLWTDIENGNIQKLNYTINNTGYIRAAITTCDSVYHSDNTFLTVYPVSLLISDENENIHLKWDTNVPMNLIDKFIIRIEGSDTTFEALKSINNLVIKRKMAYYNKSFTLELKTITGQTMSYKSPKYENNFTKYFTCKNKYIAHRGLSSLYPENTSIAFTKAADAGFEFVECDIWLTKDRQWVVCHDETIDRTSDGTGKISQYTLSEIQKFNFGYRSFGNKYPQQISTLKEFVDLCKAKNIKPIIELKDPNFVAKDIQNLVETTSNILPDSSYAFHSFNTLHLYAIRKIKKDVVLGYITSTYDPGQLKDLNALYPCFDNIYTSGVSLDKPFNNQSNSNLYNLYSSGIFVCIWVVENSVYFNNLTKNNIFVLTDIIPPAFK